MKLYIHPLRIVVLSCLLTASAIAGGIADPVGPMVLSPASTVPGPRVPVSFTVASVFTPPGTNAGTFSASGFLSTSGTTSESVQFASSTWHATTTFTDANGSFVLRNQGSFSFINANTAVGSGTWVVQSGTGAYANLHGNGDMEITVVFDATGGADLDESWTGSMLLDSGN